MIERTFNILGSILADILSLIKALPFYQIIEENLLITNALVLLIVALMIIKGINNIKTKNLDKRFRRFGFYNKDGETPKLKRKQRDKATKRGKLWDFDNRGLPPPKWDENVTSLTVALKSQIGYIEYGKTPDRTVIQAIPWKYATPEIISVHDMHYIENFINLLCVGRTGTGKTYTLLTYLGLFASVPGASISIFERKPSLSQFADTPNYFYGEKVASALKDFYENVFKVRLEALCGMTVEERNAQPLKVILIDEYSALITSLDRKAADEMRAIIGEMLSLARELRIFILIGMQRADSEYFKAGGRDQFKSIIAMGNLSKEQKNMLFNEEKDKMIARNKVGEGYYSVDGQEIKRVKVVEIKDMDELNKSIHKAMQS
jgi:hypothetical protein